MITKEDLNALGELKSARYIYYAGKEWKKFDFARGFELLMNTGNAEFIFYAGAHWKKFDFKTGIKNLLKQRS